MDFILVYTLISIYILLNAYAFVSGIKDAILWSKKGADAFTWNEHKVFVAERGIVLFIVLSVVICYSLLNKIGFPYYDNVKLFLGVCLVLSSFILSFSYFHNGAYYVARKKINPKLKHYTWRGVSNSSTADIEFSYKERLALFIVSLILLVSAVFIQLY